MFLMVKIKAIRISSLVTGKRLKVNLLNLVIKKKNNVFVRKNNKYHALLNAFFSILQSKQIERGRRPFFSRMRLHSIS